MYDVRIIYRKLGRAQYISHLDVNRLMFRALKRSRLPVWHTEGYNPHIFIAFALPLSLGFTSDYEIMDFRLNEPLPPEQIKAALGAALPDSFPIIEVLTPILKIKELCFASFSIALRCADPSALAAFLNGEQIIITKTTKRGDVRQIDIKPMINALSVECGEGTAKISLTLPAGSESNINPSLIFDAAAESGIATEIESINRTGLYDKNMSLFR